MSFNSANSKTTLDNTNIVLPQQMKSIERAYQYATSQTLAISGYYIGANIDCSTFKKVNGHVSADQAGTLYIQQSDDGFTNWLTIQTTPITAASSVSINSVTYYNGTQYEVNVTSKWARVVYVNGATAQTRFVLSAYTTPN